jgi:NADH:ubiquinone oxidoreductase subunit D
MREMVESIHIILQILNKINIKKKKKQTKNNFFSYLNYFSNSQIKSMKKVNQLS